MDYKVALWVGAAVILSYTLFGGFLAASWTDFIQGILMFLALIIIPVVAINELGGWNETVQQIGNIDPAYLRCLFRCHSYRSYFFISMGTWLFWSATYPCSIYGLKVNKRHPKSTFNWNGLDDSILVWSSLCWFCRYMPTLPIHL